MNFNEYMPKGGWIRYRRRHEIMERVKAGCWGLAIVLAYCVVGYIETGM